MLLGSKTIGESKERAIKMLNQVYDSWEKDNCAHDTALETIAARTTVDSIVTKTSTLWAAQKPGEFYPFLSLKLQCLQPLWILL